MNYLEANGGYVRLNDDTDPEEIKLRLHMSKKTFKKAAGMLYKEGKILLTKLGIKFNKTGEVPKEWEKNKMFADDEDAESKPVAKPSKQAEMKAQEKPWVDKPFVPKTKAGITKPKEGEKKENRERRDEKPASERPKKTLTFKGK